MIRNIFRLSLPILMCLWSALPAFAVSIYIENASFEAPVVDPNISFGAWPFIDGWTEIDKDEYSRSAGVFINTEPNHISELFGVPDHIYNAHGKQLAFLSPSGQSNALEQDLFSIYKVGCDYSLTVSVGVSYNSPKDSLELVLYYSDGTKKVDIVSQTILPIAWSQGLKDYSVYLPAVSADDPWAGQTIGIAIRFGGTAGGFWDIDNVRLAETYPVPISIENASFEADPNYATGWTGIDFSANTGVFTNTEPNSFKNANGNQMAFLGTKASNAFKQDLSASYNIGCDYHLTVAVGASFTSPPSTEDPIDYLELALYYSDGNEPVDIVSLQIPAMDPNQWLKNFTLYLPTVGPSDSWAGKNIGIAIRATGKAGGYWYLDNVHLAESMPLSIQIKNASFEFPVIDPLNAFGAGPIVDDWVEIDVDPEGLSRNTGVFANTEPNSFDHIVNADGSQLAFLYSEEGNTLEQELSDQYKPGCAYRLTVAIGVSSRLPPTILEPVGTLELAFYYRDMNESSESIDIVTRTIEATGLYPTKLRDYSLYLPVSPSDANWADKKIGIAIRATGVPGAVWVLDNVRLGQSPVVEDSILTNKE